MVQLEGPPLAKLIRRLVECPPEFLGVPVINDEGDVDVLAVAFDLIQDLTGKQPGQEWVAKFALKTGTDRKLLLNKLRLVLLACRIYSDECFKSLPVAPLLQQALLSGFDELASIVKADLFVLNPDRREEFSRVCLALVSLRPAGETEPEALDQLDAVSSVGRSKLIAEARRAYQRAEEVRRAMARQAAAEAAAKASRE